MTDHNDHNPSLPEDLQGLERSLDDLGAKLRDGAPSQAGDRIAEASLRALRGEPAPALKLVGTDPDSPVAPRFRQHWRLAASVALLFVAVAAVLTMRQPLTDTNQFAGADPEGADTGAYTDDWIEFEIAYVADSSGGADPLTDLYNELDELESSKATTWSLDDSLILTDGESL